MQKSYQFECPENPARWDKVAVDVKAGHIEATYKCVDPENPKIYDLIRILIEDHPKGVKLATYPVKIAPPQTTLEMHIQEGDGEHVFDRVKPPNFAVRLETGHLYHAKIREWFNDAKDKSEDVLDVWNGLWLLMQALKEEKEKKSFV